jgi:5-methyltetrahydrofolate--homocysteine methyltransferase
MSLTFLDEIKIRTLVADGAMGTMLQKNGLTVGGCPEEWNISHPDIVQNIHRQYFAAGADLVETNTFGGNRYRLGVAGSVGPTGEFLEPIGTVTFDNLVEIFQEQIAALAGGGVDLIIVETMTDLQEARAALVAAKKVNSALPVAVTMTFEKGPAGYKTMMGISPGNLITLLINEGADMLGANCGFGMEEMIEIMTEFRNLSAHPMLAQANAGLPQWDGHKNIYSETPLQRGQAVPKLLKLNINVIGGCCGTTPEHIQAIRRAVDTYSQKK